MPRLNEFQLPERLGRTNTLVSANAVYLWEENELVIKKRKDNIGGKTVQQIIKYLGTGLVVAACLAPVQAIAQSAIEQIASLNAAGRALEAYQLSMRLLSQYEGEPAFDLHYGVAAVDSGNVSEGAFALERVLMNEPTNDYARLELARAYFVMEEDERAKAEFEQVLAADPPSEVVQNVRPYLDAIKARESRRKTTFTSSIELSGGYDSNISAAPDTDTFLIPLFGIEARLGNTQTSDSFAQANFNARLSHPIQFGTNLFVSGNASQRKNSSGQIDITGYNLEGGITHQDGANNFRLAIQAGILDVDGQNYRDSVGLSGSWQRALNAQTAVTGFVQLSQLDHTAGLEFKDALLSIVGVNAQHQFIAPLKPVLSITATVGRENADDLTLNGALANTERDILGLDGSLSLSLRPDLLFTGSIRYQGSEYGGREALFGRVRQDDNYQGSVALAWRATDELVLKLNASAGKNESNIPLLEYDRNQIVLSASYNYR